MKFHKDSSFNRPLVLEGAGGLFVPINETMITKDLVKRLDFLVILVARSGLGALLSIEHLNRKIKILGILLNGELNSGNAAAIRPIAKDISQSSKFQNYIWLLL